MIKKLLIAALCLSLVFAAGCSSLSGSQSPPTHEIVKKAAISPKWQVYQLRFELPAGTEFPVLLKLADGDKVDGYFTLEKGAAVDFRVNAISQVYASQGTSGKVTSDRFTFTASQSQGSTYIITLRNGDPKDSDTVFLELMYPAAGQIFIPLEAK